MVSLRIVTPGQDDEFVGYWGVIESVSEEGMLVKVEGGSDDEYEMIPPDLNYLEEAQHKYYQFNESDDVVEDVDYEVKMVGSNDIDAL